MNSPATPVATLAETACLSLDKLLAPLPDRSERDEAVERPVLVLLAAGKGTRFGNDPKCIQPVRGVPLARHSILAFRRFNPAATVVAIVGYRHQEVAASLGPDSLYIRSDNPAGGTGFAAYEAFCLPELEARDRLLVITMGDRIVPAATFQRLWERHHAEGHEADLTFLTAQYEPPRNRGKGRVLRDEQGRVQRIIEDREIAAERDVVTRQALANLTEGNCPLYVVRARRLKQVLAELTNDNAQGQFYLTDIINQVSREGGVIRTLTVTPAEPEYDLLCADVTRPEDLALLEGLLVSRDGRLVTGEDEVEAAYQTLVEGRPAVQVAAIARQLEELQDSIAREKLNFGHERPIGIGVSGGRLRIAFMHPDMTRFHGPAWQMPIGAGDASGDEQIVMLTQEADDRRLHLTPLNPKYRESINDLPDDADSMYPGESICDLATYEAFGTRMSETLLLSLGYFSEAELEERRRRALPLPPPSLWVGNSMRRPFALIGNAIASLRTLREGHLGRRVQEHLGRGRFLGLRIVCTGGIPQGGFSSSSAVTVALKNALNALFELGIPPDLLVHLACQAEYGTGVRAGALDQATEQRGRAGQGALISSNPRDRYCILGVYPVPSDRFRILFPYSVDRDREAWRWSWGGYAADTGGQRLTAGELRKLTGKAAEIAAILVRLPLETSFFKPLEENLLESGELSREDAAWIAGTLRQVPLLIGRDELWDRLREHRSWYSDQMQAAERLDPTTATHRADAAIDALFDGWREPVLTRSDASGASVEERGVPLRAMLAYLFGEVAKNFQLIRNPQSWIRCVSASQRGDRCVDILPHSLPGRAELEGETAWERDSLGPARLERWLEYCGARPFDYNRGLSDDELSAEEPPVWHRLPGSSFFRGLPLIDLAEAMLKRSFGDDAVAVRVNAAGQGDFFQVHVDTQQADPEAVKDFLRHAFYARFGLCPDPEFVEPHPGGGAAGTRLSRYDALEVLIRKLRAASVAAC